VFVDGALLRTLRGDGLVAEFETILEDYVARRFPAPGVRAAEAATREGTHEVRVADAAAGAETAVSR